MKLSSRGQKWLKAVHLLFVCLWVCGGISLILMGYGLPPEGGGELYGIDRTIKFIDDLIIVPGAMGCLLTGILYGSLTNWGFFKHKWIIVKWVVTLGGIVFGTFYLGEWLNTLAPMSKEMGLAAVEDPVYIENKNLNLHWSLVQVASLILAVFLSTLKPWKAKAKPSA